MNTKFTIACLVAMILGLAACGDNGESKTDAKAPAPETSATGEDKTSLDVFKEKVDAATQSAAEAGDQAAEATAAAAQSLSEKGGEMADTASEKGSELADAADAKARQMIASVQDYLAENDLDSAQGIMDNLNQIKDSLSETLKTEIEALQAKIASMTGDDSAG